MPPVFLLLLTLLPGALLGQERPPTPVIVAEVLEQPLVEDLSFVGRILPVRSSRVAAETEGRAVRRFKEAGQAVRTGDPLFALANDPLQASLAEAEADLALRQFNHDRSRRLRVTNSVSEQDLRNKAYELARAEAKLTGLQAQVANLLVRAPFSGHIIRTFTEVGEWVGRGGEIAQVISIDTVRVIVEVPERHVSQLALGDHVAIVVDALGSDPIAGLVTAISAEGFASSHTFPVIVEAANPPRPDAQQYVRPSALPNRAGHGIASSTQGRPSLRPTRTGRVPRPRRQGPQPPRRNRAGAQGLRGRYRRTRTRRSSGGTRQ